MRWCPNSSCSFARRFNRPGEYTDAAVTCSDCGATLTEVPPVAPPVAVPEPVVRPAEGNDAIERLLVTLACAAGILVLSHLSAFGLPDGVLGDDEVAVPLLPLGILPFVTAFLLVELVALLLPLA